MESINALKAQGKSSQYVNNLVIEIDIAHHAERQILGVDYLRLGNVHYKIFKQLEFLLNDNERHTLEKRIIESTRSSCNFLCKCLEVTQNGSYDSKIFIDNLNLSINTLPILGYIYFEAVSEISMLYSPNKNNELNNWPYKNLTFTTFPSMLEKFSLSQFKLSYEQLTHFLQGLGKNVIDLVIQRIAYLCVSRLLNDDEVYKLNWNTIYWSIDEIEKYFAPLMGHLIHRYLRSMGRYPDFYFYFEQTKALQIWNYWNSMNVIAPFNGILPKGEVGVNVAYSELSYKIYKGNYKKFGDEFIVELNEELPVKLTPRLNDIKNSFLR